MSGPDTRARSLLMCLEKPGDSERQVLRAIYGAGFQERLPVWREALHAFLGRFGDCDVRLFRAPGRINLRGMHVDTHGGYLNLMSHQREVLLVAAPVRAAAFTIANADPRYDEVACCAGLEHACSTEGWAGYLHGCLDVAEANLREFAQGFNGVVAGDLPAEAGLSSSAALCASVLYAMTAVNHQLLAATEFIAGCRDAEWRAGARTGLSDPAAIALAGVGEVVHGVIGADRPDVAAMERYTLSEELSVVLADSGTRRALSGADAGRYAGNRFAYSVAMDLLQHLWPVKGNGLHAIASVLAPHENGRFYRELSQVPETLSLEDLRTHFPLPSWDAAWERYMAPLEKEALPKEVALRGPLIFGLAETARAQQFAAKMIEGDYSEAGRLMTLGHAGDRVTNGGIGRVGDAQLAAWAEAGQPLWLCPGAFSASTPALDMLVDAAVGSGALGASLTGAGYGGHIVALCRRDGAGAVVDALKRALQCEAYAGVAGRAFEPAEAERAVAINRAVSRAGELVL